MTPSYEIKVKTGTYMDRDGKERTGWTKIGVVFEKDGALFGSLSTIPLNWDGRFNMFPPREQDLEGFPAAPRGEPNRQQRAGRRPVDDDYAPF